MECFAAEYGIFISYPNVTMDFKVNCIKALLNVCPESCIKSVIEDEIFSGLRVYFNDVSVVKTALKRLNSTVSEKSVRIYPLTTNLTIHNVIPKPNTDACHALRELMEKRFGKVLKVSKVPLCEEFPDIDTGKWHVLLEIPEMEELEIFNKIGSSETTLEAPSMEKKMIVTFSCNICGGEDHTQQGCLEEKTASKSDSISKSSSKQGAKQQAEVEGHEIALEKTCANTNLCTEPSVSPKPLNLKTTNSPEAGSQIDINKELLQKVYYLSWKYSEAKNKKNETSTFNCNIKRTSDQEHHQQSFSAPQTSGWPVPNEEDVLPLLNDMKPTKEKKELLSAAAKKMDITVPYFTPSSVAVVNPVTQCASSSTQQHFDNFNPLQKRKQEEESDCKVNTILPSAKKMKVQHDMVKKKMKFSPCVARCISKACTVLSAEDLESFFIHVKKKSNPESIALNYTKDINGLKLQLNDIISVYYGSPESGTNEDKLFIKWLQRLLHRFSETSNEGQKPGFCIQDR